MESFVFSADGHVREPNDLFEAALPASLRPRAIKAERRDGYLCTVSGEKVIHRLKLPPRLEGWGGAKRLGLSNFEGRLEDMEADGIVSPPENNGNREVLAPPPPEL